MAACGELVIPTEELRAGAASHAGEHWHQIDWYQAHRLVRRLQARIVKATQAGRWGKVAALQHLLTHSYSGKVLAVKRVTDNPGKHTAGVDRVIWDTPSKKMAAVHALRQRGYRAQPLRRVHISKKDGRTRPLSIPTLADRAMQALYLLALDPVAEVTGDLNSYGYRCERSTADAMAQCFRLLSKRQSPQWILEGDIRSCFERISHDWLMAHVPMNKTILRKWLKAGYMEQHVLRPTDAGTPQGGIASPVLANLTLDGLERLLREQFPKPHSGYNAKVNLVRFADDLIITGESKELLEMQVRPLVEVFLRERGLDLATTFIVKDTGFGCSYGAYGPGDEDTNYFRTMHWLFPWVTMTPVIKLGTSANCVITVPLDDTHTMSWGMTTGRLDQPPSKTLPPGGGRGLLPNTADFLGRYRLKFFYETAESGNFDFGVDREVQKTSRTVTGYTGMPSVIVQDSAITWSQGAIVDRSKEALGSTDAMIIRVRRRLLTAAKELREHGTIPPGVDQPQLYRQRSGWALVPKDADFWEYLRPLREAFQKVDTSHTDGKGARNGVVPVDQHVDDAASAPEPVEQKV